MNTATLGVSNDSPSHAHKDFLSFRLGHERYGIELLKVQEIRRYERPLPIPHSPPTLLGLLDIRGEITPVWDARLALGLPSVHYGVNTVTVLLSLDERHMGLVVDEVSDIARVRLDSIQSVQVSSGALPSNAVLGVASVQDAQDCHMLILLDAECLAPVQLQDAPTKLH